MADITMVMYQDRDRFDVDVFQLDASTHVQVPVLELQTKNDELTIWLSDGQLDELEEAIAKYRRKHGPVPPTPELVSDAELDAMGFERVAG